MDRRANLWNGSVVDEHLGRGSLEDDSRRSARAARDSQSLRRCQGSGPNRHWHIRRRAAIVPHLDGDQPSGAPGSNRVDSSWSYAGDTQIRQAAIAVHPIIEEPRQIASRSPFEQSLKLPGIRVLPVLPVELEGASQCIVSHDRAKHLQDGRSFGAVVDLIARVDKTLSLGW